MLLLINKFKLREFKLSYKVLSHLLKRRRIWLKILFNKCDSNALTALMCKIIVIANAKIRDLINQSEAIKI